MEVRDGKLGLTIYEVTAGVLTVLSKIRGYSSSCYTRRGSLKKVLQALPPLLALVLPHFFLACFRSSPTTESLEQATCADVLWTLVTQSSSPSADVRKGQGRLRDEPKEHSA